MRSNYLEFSDLMLKSINDDLSYGEQLQLLKLVGEKEQVRIILWSLTDQLELEKKLREMESFDVRTGWERLQKAIHKNQSHASGCKPEFDYTGEDDDYNGNLIVGIENSFLSHSYNNGILRLSLPQETPADIVDLSNCDREFLMKLYMRFHAPESNFPVVHIKSAALSQKTNNKSLECKDAIGFLLYFAKDLISVSLINWENNDAPNTPGERMGPLLKLGKMNKKIYSATCQPTGNQL